MELSSANSGHKPNHVDGSKRLPGPSKRIRNNPDSMLNGKKSDELSKKAKRRLRQKARKTQESANINNAELKTEINILKVMKRVKSGGKIHADKEKLLSNHIREKGNFLVNSMQNQHII